MERVWKERYAGWEKGLHNGDDLYLKPRKTMAMPASEDCGYVLPPPINRNRLQPVKRSTGIKAH